MVARHKQAWQASFSTRVLGAVAIFLSVYLVYGMAVADWRFWQDDYGLQYEGRTITSWREVGRYWTNERPIMNVVLPTNMVSEWDQHFSSNFYRPLTAIVLSLETKVLTPYQAYLFSILLFALMIALLFYFLTLFLPIILAGLVALFLATHASLACWIGFLCTQPYIFVPLVILTVCWALRKAIDSGRYWYAIVAWVPFGMHLLFHELLLVVPVWLTVVVPWYLMKTGERAWIKKTVYLVAPFFALVLLYMMAKLWVYPVSAPGRDLLLFLTSFVDHMMQKIRMHDLTRMIVSLVGLDWLGEGTRYIKIPFILFVGSAWMALFWRTTHKIEMALCGFSAVLFAWPAILLFFAPQYTFLSQIFLLISFAIGVMDSLVAKRIFAVVILVLSVFGLANAVSGLRAYEHRIVVADTALQDCAKQLTNGAYAGKTVFFIGTPEELFPWGGTAQALRCYTGNLNLPVCLHWRLMSRFAMSCADQMAAYPPREPLMDIEYVGGPTFHMISRDDKRLWFFYGNGNSVCSLGERVVNRYATTPWGTRAYDVTMTLDEEWLRHGIVPVTWDYQEQRLKILTTKDNLCS